MTEKDLIIQDLRRENAELRARMPKYPAEYIEREALRDALYDADAITMEGVKIFNQFPATDVAPVRHGHWIEVSTTKRERIFKCSVCGNVLDFDGVNAGRGDANYCPNCGAKIAR